MNGTLPRTELRFSPICLGGIITDSASPLLRCLDEYVEWGGNCFDTANVYGKWLPAGENAHERVLGRWLAAKPPSVRDTLHICTKGAHPPIGDMTTRRLSRDEVAGDLDESLRALGLECVSLYWLHRDDPGRPVEEILSYLSDFRKQGKIRYFGVSNWSPARLRQAEDCAAAMGITGFVANQPLWSCALANPETLIASDLAAMDNDMFRFHTEAGLAVMPYSSNANGYFSKLAAGAALPPDTAERYDCAENRRRFDVLNAIAAERGCTVHQAALAYLRHQPFPVIPIIGYSSSEQLHESLDAAGIALSDDEIRRIRGNASF